MEMFIFVMTILLQYVNIFWLCIMIAVGNVVFKLVFFKLLTLFHYI